MTMPMPDRDMDAAYTPEAQRRHIETHRVYVAGGRCASVALTKGWCNRPATPHNEHWSTGIPATNIERWTDREATLCPCALAATSPRKL